MNNNKKKKNDKHNNDKHNNDNNNANLTAVSLSRGGPADGAGSARLNPKP